MLRRLKSVCANLFRANIVISVVVPNYNNGKYLGDCISSILSQTYKNIEILIVDDKSTDDSLSVIQKYTDKRLRVIRLDKNIGVSAARNVGIREARGEFLTTLDSDDVYTNENKLTQELELIRVHKSAGHDVVAFSNIVRISEDGRLQEEVGDKDNIKEGCIFKGLLARSVFIPRDFLCLREIYLTVGLYNEDIDLYEDWDLKLRISKAYAYFYTNLTGVGYRDRPEGLSKVASDQHAKWKSHIYESHK
jgi:glycosyltransferase involved in cell wall biosynthesis